MHCFRYESAPHNARRQSFCINTNRFRGTEVKRTLNGWVILVDEVRLDQLDCEARLADATAADYHQLVFPCELQRN